MPNVGQYCSRTVVTARPGDGVQDIARLMRDRHVGCVVVVHDDGVNGRVPIGILTDRDIVVGLLAQTDQQLQLVEQTRSSHCMSVAVRNSSNPCAGRSGLVHSSRVSAA